MSWFLWSMIKVVLSLCSEPVKVIHLFTVLNSCEYESTGTWSNNPKADICYAVIENNGEIIAQKPLMRLYILRWLKGNKPMDYNSRHVGLVFKYFVHDGQCILSAGLP